MDSDDESSERELECDGRGSNGNRFVRRLIPSVAAVSLTMGGCGPDESDDEEDDPPKVEVESVTKMELSEFCRQEQNCGSDFVFNGLRDCVHYYEYSIGYYEQYYQEYLGRACSQAFIVFWQCRNIESRECLNGTFQYEVNCLSEYEGFYESCSGTSSFSGYY